ncbi:MAG: DUF5360 family protein [Hyphomonadaceae bacterium]|nr:DUF5360 family protein [Hyphomonadaceae bacterium]
MSPVLTFALTITDVAFLVYWTMAALHALALVQIPQDWLYANAGDPRVVAWNWSFFPLDVAFSVTGLAAVRCARRGAVIWRPLALISLVLTMVAGGMAVGYWVLMGDFDPFWIGANALLFIWPILFLGGLVKSLSGATSTLGGETAKDSA